MPEYDNNMTGVVFKNKRKETEKHPDYTGTTTIDGVEYWASYWLKTSKTGETFMSVSYKRKDDQSSSKPAPSNDKQDSFIP